MTAELMGVPLSRFEDPIKVALDSYQEISGDRLRFDREKALRLELTPDKPNSARSATDVLFQKGFNQEIIGKLFVIAFKPGDGTGSSEYYKLENLQIDGRYPREVKVLPRDKKGIHSEIHLTIASHAVDDVHAEPKPFAGSLDLLGVKQNTVVKIGELGHENLATVLSPIVTFTVGYTAGERFGDPHAVYNPSLALQVCAFLAVSDDVYAKHPDIFDGLNPHLPLKE